MFVQFSKTRDAHYRSEMNFIWSSYSIRYLFIEHLLISDTNKKKTKKPVRNDGLPTGDHEWSDVVKYQNESFLPLMAEYEGCMVKWFENKDGSFEHVESSLGPGEKRIVPVFQDESLFHTGEYKLNVWCVGSLCLRQVLTLFLGKGCRWVCKSSWKRAMGESFMCQTLLRKKMVTSLSKIKMAW